MKWTSIPASSHQFLITKPRCINTIRDYNNQYIIIKLPYWEKPTQRRVYTSCLRVRFLHSVVFWKYLRWFSHVYENIYIYNYNTKKTQRNAENAWVNGMWQLGLSDQSTILDSEIVCSRRQSLKRNIVQKSQNWS